MKATALKVLLLEDNPVNARVVEEMLRRSESPLFQVQRAETLVGALDLLARSDFDVALVDLMLPDSQGLETFLTVQRHAGGLPLVVLSGMENESLALTAVEKGAQDYIPKGSLTSDALVRSINYAVARRRSSPKLIGQSPEPATVIGFLGAKGGAGTTTLACHMALQLKRLTGKPVLMIDLDSSSASASFYLKADSPYTIVDATANLQRLDGDLWKALVSSTGGVDLLRSPGWAEMGGQFSGDRARHVVRFAAPMYGYIVLHLGRLNPISMSVLEETRELFTVTTMDLPALFEASRVYRQLVDRGLPKDQIRLILNRKPKSTAVSSRDLEQALGCDLYAVVNDHGDEVEEAFAEGKYLEAQRGLAAQMGDLTSRWLGLKTAAAPNRSVAQLVSRFFANPNVVPERAG